MPLLHFKQNLCLKNHGVDYYNLLLNNAVEWRGVCKVVRQSGLSACLCCQTRLRRARFPKIPRQC